MRSQDLQHKLFIITRPDDSGQALTARYLADGYEAVHMPVMEYKMNNDLPRKTIAQKIINAPGLALTSANGARAFADIMAQNKKSEKIIALDKKIIFAVGPMTAAAVTEKIGQCDMIIAGGNVEKLVKSIVAEYKKKPWPLDKTLVHVGAVTAAGEGAGIDLVSKLRGMHIPAEKIALYDMVAVGKMADNVLQKISHHPNNGDRVLLFFSPRTVALTVRLLRRHGLASSDFFAQCHSQAVAGVARDAGFMTI